MTAMSEVKWHKGSDLPGVRAEPGDWYAQVDGKTVARVSIRGRSGHWNRYAGRAYGRSVSGATLAEIKQ